jgi:hypothetical protein
MRHSCLHTVARRSYCCQTRDGNGPRSPVGISSIRGCYWGVFTPRGGLNGLKVIPVGWKWGTEHSLVPRPRYPPGSRIYAFVVIIGLKKPNREYEPKPTKKSYINSTSQSIALTQSPSPSHLVRQPLPPPFTLLQPRVVAASLVRAWGVRSCAGWERCSMTISSPSNNAASATRTRTVPVPRAAECWPQPAGRAPESWRSDVIPNLSLFSTNR